MSKKIARDLNPVNMEERIYQVENETKVIKDDITEITEKLPVANPETEATETLEKITIDGDTYEVGGGEDLSEILVEEYNPTNTYNLGDFVKIENKIYEVTKDNTTGENPSGLVQTRIPGKYITDEEIILYNPAGTYDTVSKILTIDVSSALEHIKNHFTTGSIFGEKRIAYDPNTSDSDYNPRVVKRNNTPKKIRISLWNISGLEDTSYQVKVIYGKEEADTSGETPVITKTGLVNVFIDKVYGYETTTDGTAGTYPNYFILHSVGNVAGGNEISGKYAINAINSVYHENVSNGIIQEHSILFDIKNSNLKDFDSSGVNFETLAFDIF